MLALIRTVSKRPWLVATLFAAGIGAAFWFSPPAKTSASLLKMLPENHPGVEEYRKFQRTYNVGDAIAISFTNQNLFSRQSLNTIRELTTKIESISGISGATALTSVQLPHVVGEGVEFAKLVPEDDLSSLSDAELDEIRQKALGNALIVGRVISADGKTTGILAETNSAVTDTEFREILSKIQLEVDKLRSAGADVRLISQGSIEQQVETLMLTHTSYYWLLAGVLTMSWLFFVLGSVSLATVGAVYAAAVTAASLAIVRYLGITFDIVAVCGPALGLMVTLATLTPLLHQFQRSIAHGGTHLEAIQATYLVKQSHLVMLAIAAALVGSTLIISDFASLRNAGTVLLATVGTNMLFSLLLLPSMLTLEVKAYPSHHNVAIRNAIKARLSRIDQTSVPVRLLLGTVSAALFAAAVWQYTLRATETTPARFLAADNSVQRDFRYFDAQFGGPELIDLEATTTNQAENFFSSSVLMTLNEVQNSFKKTFPESVSGTVSIADYFKELHKAFTPGVTGDGMPTKEDDFKNYADLLELSDGKVMGKMLTIDKAKARILVSRRLTGWNPVKMTQFQDKDLPLLTKGEIEVKVSGYAKYLRELDQATKRAADKHRNVSLAVFAIFVLLTSRSFLVTLTMTAAATLATLIPAAFLAMSGSSFDVATMPMYAFGLTAAFIASLPVLANYRAKAIDSQDFAARRLWHACVDTIPEIMATVPLIALAAGAQWLSGIASIGRVGMMGAVTALGCGAAVALLVPMLVARGNHSEHQSGKASGHDQQRVNRALDQVERDEKASVPSRRAS